MFSIEPCALPANSLLAAYNQPGTYTDCFVTEVAGSITYKQYVYSFYTSWLFRIERQLLGWLVSKVSTDAELVQLTEGSKDSFSAWHVEGRADGQLLLSDYQNRTRSWLMVAHADVGGIKITRLYFGSAVTPIDTPESEKKSLGLVFSLLLGFHKCYSIFLLYFAKNKLQQ